jgi:hypothetical protein
MSSVCRKLVFENGWTIDVHEEWHGEILYRKWPPGTETQSEFSGLARMVAPEFEDEISKHPHEVIWQEPPDASQT